MMTIYILSIGVFLKPFTDIRPLGVVTSLGASAFMSLFPDQVNQTKKNPAVTPGQVQGGN